MGLYSFHLTEEIARWRFEVLIHSIPTWFIAFTNPTAGPWKRVMGKDDNGNEGEVYRFPRDADGPDMILVSDELKTIAIVEAKDSLAKFQVDAQLIKSAAVVIDLANVLAGLGKNKFWGPRSQYSICAGLLWGGERASSETDWHALVRRFTRELGNTNACITRQCICIEVLKGSTDEELDVSIYVQRHEAGNREVPAAALLRSFSLSR
jgi:hypothetical protein